MIYFNFLYSPSGGGLQNSISFLNNLINLNYDFSDSCCIVVEDTYLEKLCIDRGIASIRVGAGSFKKLSFELFSRKYIKSNDIVFSIFGPPMLTLSNHCLNVGGMAISNVFYPEIDFWSYEPWFSRGIRNFKDIYRKWRYKKLDYWIFETDILADKAIGKFNFPESRVEVVKMSPSNLVCLDNVNSERQFFKNLDGRTKFLMLCNGHPNKRHHLLPELARKLKDKDICEPVFIFTSTDSKYMREVMGCVKNANVEEYFVNVGSIQQQDVATLISQVDFVVNISVLESFSNNYVEAWKMRKPLLTVDAEWSRGAAKDAAFYINVVNEIKLDEFVSVLRANVDEVVTHGCKILQEYPSGEDKALAYLDAISKAKALGKITPKQRQGIRM